MRCLRLLLFIAILGFSANSIADAAPVWADSVDGYGSKVQNFGVRGAGNGTPMTPATAFWVLGEPDAVVNATNNGLHPDHVAGWRSDAPGQFIVVGFSAGLVDGAGDDLTIRLFSGPSAGADVLASVDGIDFQRIGAIGPGTPLQIRDETFDFAGLFGDPVHFIRVERVANGRQTGMFFDAFGGDATTVIPLPPSLLMLAPSLVVLGVLRVRARRRWYG